jgi:hypothetical protein
MRSIHSCALAAALVLATGAAVSAAEPGLRRVLLSTGGVGFFGYEATPDAEGRIWLTVPLAQVDDILKSLTVLGGDGAVRAVRLDGPTPLGDLFREVPFGEGDLADLPSLLTRLRGNEVEVVGRSSLHGRILSVAREEVVEGETRSVRHRLSLASPDGIRSVVLETVDGLTFADPTLQAQLDQLLARLAESGATQERRLEIVLAGPPAAPVDLGYLAETPLWKSSYRLVAGDSEGRLQGWAILENASGKDWADVAVTLIGGSPRALRQALFASYFVERPEVPLGGGEARKERRELALAAAPPMAAEAADGLTRAFAAPPLETASAQELTAQTLFPLPHPVTLARGQTVMAPIVDRAVPLERVALYRAAQVGRHPQSALRVRNASGTSLPAGLATLYEALPQGGLTFLGDATLPQLAPGAEELLAYGLDGNIDVTVAEESQGRIDRVRVTDGVLELTRLEQQRFAYTVTGRFAGAAREFVLEQMRPADWRVAAPADAVVEGDLVTIRRSLEPAGKLHIALILERPVVQSFALTEQDPQELLLAFSGVEPPPELRVALGRLQEFARAEGEIERQVAQAEQRRDEIHQDQARLRENLGAVPPESDLARRLLAEMANGEDELMTLGARVTELRAELARATEARLAYLRTLRI